MSRLRGPAPWFDAADQVVERATKWPTFELLRTVIEQSTSSLRSEALVKLAQLEERVTSHSQSQTGEAEV